MRKRHFATARRDHKKAFKIDKTIRKVARERTDLSEEDLDEVLDAHETTGA